MTMVPAQNLFKLNHYGGYGGCGDWYKKRIDLMSPIAGYDYCSATFLGSDLQVDRMAEDQSRSNSPNEAGSSSKDVREEKDEGWLQLGIGGYMTSRDDKLDPVKTTTQKDELIELDLLPGVNTRHANSLAPITHMTEFQAPRPSTDFTGASSFSPSLFWQYPRTSSTLPQPEFSWGFRPNQWNIAASSSSSSASSSSSSSIRVAPYFAPPFQLHPGIDLARPNSELRVIDTPRRHHSGIWFTLQASENQTREPYLSQIPKSYLRIKDGRMTVRLLMKYLANKLKLDSESEVEIRCRGQQLLPFMTLQHVRDNIWSSSRGDVVVTLLPDSSTSDQLMILHYARSTASA